MTQPVDLFADHIYAAMSMDKKLEHRVTGAGGVWIRARCHQVGQEAVAGRGDDLTDLFIVCAV